MFLVTSDHEPKIFDNKEELHNYLKTLCFEWVLSPCYSSSDNDTWEDLYNYCVKEKYFGDIAQVFKIDLFFTAGGLSFSTDSPSVTKVGDKFNCQRIY